MIADGNPAEIRGVNQVGLERRGFDADDIRTLREAYRLLCRANLNVKQACETIRAELPSRRPYRPPSRLYRSEQARNRQVGGGGKADVMR